MTARRALVAALVALVAAGLPGAPAGAQEPAGPGSPDSPEVLDSDPVDVPVPDALGADDGLPTGFVTPEGQPGIGGIGGVGLPLVLGAGGLAEASSLSGAPVTDDYVQVTRLLEQQNLARQALEAAERARADAERRRLEALRNRGDRVPDSVPHAQLFNDAGAVHVVDPRLLAAVAVAGSNLRDDAGCPDGPGPRGLMALDPSVAASYGADPCDAAQAVEVAAVLLGGLYGRYGSWDLALAAYRAGAAEVDRARAVPGSARGFVDAVNAQWARYKESSASTAAETSAQGPNGPICVRAAAGITVACHLAGNVEAMVGAAAADGVTLTGSGHRDSGEQLRLRRANCGTSNYDVYDKPPDQCSPPTARPGRSMHERGEAIDFRDCSSRSTACHQWLKRRGAEFGFYNLPSEPWHWSTTGA